MWLSKQTSDSVKILVVCARAEDGDLIRVGEAAELIGVTRQNGLKLVNALVALGFLETVRGRSGGIRLALDASDIPLGRAILQIERYLSQRSELEAGLSQLNALFDSAVQAFADSLDQHSLAELASGNSGVPLALPGKSSTASSRRAERRRVS